MFYVALLLHLLVSLDFLIVWQREKLMVVKVIWKELESNLNTRAKIFWSMGMMKMDAI